MMTRKHAYYQGIRMVSYDLVKEFLVALGAVLALVLVLSAFLSSPDVHPLTIQGVAQQSPQSFVQTSLDELDGNGLIAGYGPPYNNGSGAVQYIGPISLQKLAGVHIPVDTAQAYVLGPLSQVASTNASWKAALDRYNSASPAQQASWTDAYNKALQKARETPPHLSVPACRCGPVPSMMAALLTLGQRGAMDGLLLTGGHFYQTDYTRPLLFMGEPNNNVVQAQANAFNLQGNQWGAMNETGNYPGQAWLWLYTLFYQIPPFNSAWAANVDALALFSVTILSLLLLFLPWIPGLNRLPRYVKVYRLIWKDYYREQRPKSTTPSDAGTPQPTAGVGV